jgi:hypothetical protein
VIISAAGAIVGLILLLFAWRGRRIDDHPLCRKCKFDLVGLPAGAQNCSECGVSLKRRRAIRMGHRRVRRIWLLLAIVMVGGSGGRIGVQAHYFVTHNDLDAYKPAWWLLMEAGSPRASARRDSALSRLAELWRGGKLSPDQSAQVLQLILAAQADQTRQWSSQWEEIFEEMHNKDMVSVDDWKTYVRQGYGLALVSSWKNNLLVIDITQIPQPRLVRSDGRDMFVLESVRVGTSRVFPKAFHFEGLQVFDFPAQIPLSPEELQGERTLDVKVVVRHRVIGGFFRREVYDMEDLTLKTNLTSPLRQP